MPLQRKKISSGFKESGMYQKWNFIVRYYNEGIIREDFNHLAWVNYDSYKEDLKKKSLGVSVVECLGVVLFVPSIIWWNFMPFKYRWPKEIEAIFGKANYY
ncbi:hypothetical protein RE428_46750 [Marinobacter nanhaiticus D15-8W]|nr:hypothetical protein RE428_46750 [Marinobacter nanhaiticus D15-8W]